MGRRGWARCTCGGRIRGTGIRQAGGERGGRAHRPDECERAQDVWAEGGGRAVRAEAESAGRVDGADGRRGTRRGDAERDAERAGGGGFGRGVRVGGAGDGGGIPAGAGYARPAEAAAGRGVGWGARERIDGTPAGGQFEYEF